MLDPFSICGRVHDFSSMVFIVSFFNLVHYLLKSMASVFEIMTYVTLRTSVIKPSSFCSKQQMFKLDLIIVIHPEKRQKVKLIPRHFHLEILMLFVFTTNVSWFDAALVGIL